jgi:hypothetical protein
VAAAVVAKGSVAEKAKTQAEEATAIEVVTAKVVGTVAGKEKTQVEEATAKVVTGRYCCLCRCPCLGLGLGLCFRLSLRLGFRLGCRLGLRSRSWSSQTERNVLLLSAAVLASFLVLFDWSHFEYFCLSFSLFYRYMIYLTAENNNPKPNPKPTLPYLKAVEDTVEAIVVAGTVEAAIVAVTVAARTDPATAIVTETVTGKFWLVP